MHPPLQRKTILHTNARHTAGRFVFCYCLKEILQELTKVNKPFLTVSISIGCKSVILPTVKPLNMRVDKMDKMSRQIHGERRICVSTNSKM